MRATGWRAVAPAAALLLAAVSARAETVAVRSGEHDGFTRIVVNLGAPAAWRLDRSETGYELAVDRPDLDFDLSRAFDLIARNRVADLAPAGGPGRLAVTLGCDCHAEACLLYTSDAA
ncbi:MAG: hypothetical protein N2422_09975, partial [Rhodobacteraceae bacterium]|nr:hypothetical protein [Paracoccaceae bacterium]